MISNVQLLSKSKKIFDKSLCIICQKPFSLISEVNGCKQIRLMASIRKDIVFERLKILSETELFFYHMSIECYRKYCNTFSIKRHKHPLESTKNKKVCKAVVECVENEKSINTTNEFDFKKKCIICGWSSKNGCNVLSCIGSTRESEFRQIALYYKNTEKAFDRINAFDSKIALNKDENLKILCHENCLRRIE